MKIENVRVYGLEESIIASGYPMQVETLSGEEFDNECEFLSYGLEHGIEDFSEGSMKQFNKHMKRIKSLGNAIPNSGHDCAIKGIIVQVDITAPQYFWLQWERYHFQDTISSQSTMHRITQMDLKSQMNKYVLPIQISTLNKLIDVYNTYSKDDYARGIEIEYFPMYKIKVHSKQELFQYIISNTPEGIELTRRLTFNYLQLKSMYNQRGKHKLEEWKDIFCPWILTLPHFKELCLKEK